MKAVLLTLPAAQFVMILEASVNVSIATVASDPGTTVTGILTTITPYTLVMAALMMITGGPMGTILGRIDPPTGQHLGNFPQLFTHLARIDAAKRLIARPSR